MNYLLIAIIFAIIFRRPDIIVIFLATAGLCLILGKILDRMK
jgi:hypothetical protein